MHAHIRPVLFVHCHSGHMVLHQGGSKIGDRTLLISPLHLCTAKPPLLLNHLLYHIVLCPVGPVKVSGALPSTNDESYSICCFPSCPFTHITPNFPQFCTMMVTPNFAQFCTMMVGGLVVKSSHSVCFVPFSSIMGHIISSIRIDFSCKQVLHLYVSPSSFWFSSWACLLQPTK